ncbi:hypothetical protein K502DRAFT_323244 [Neoconidiobolus thromboides FSU 785]|nr:hypothetical protein K502DRAFT_323244 [Neoconidiobolus thromboides FSU 785]
MSTLANSELVVPPSITLKDGSVVKVNDCVYLAAIKPGEFYQVVRITHIFPSKSKKDVNLEVCHFYRKFNTGCEWNSKDDPNLLFMTYSTEVIHISHIIGKCVVTHVSYISDINSYKQLENHFYFSQFYERFRSILLEVLPTEMITNLPENILEKLKQMFTFIFAEKSEVKKLQEAIRSCDNCQKWAPSNTSLRCMFCDKAFHPECAVPKVTRKFSKGFLFQCSTCLAKANVDFNDPSQTIPKLKQAELPPSPKGKGSELQGALADPNEIFTQVELRCTDLQPIRYYGKYTTIEDGSELSRNIYYTSPVPVGKAHQIEIPEYQGPDRTIPKKGYNDYETKKEEDKEYRYFLTNEQVKEKGKLEEEELKKLDDPKFDEELDKELFPISKNQTILFTANTLRKRLLTKRIVKKVKSMNWPIPTHSNQFNDKLYYLIYKTNFNEEKVIKELKLLSPLDYNYQAHLAPEKQFENALLKYHPDFDKIAAEFPSMTDKGALERFYIWKADVERERARLGTKFKPRRKKLMNLIFPDDLEYIPDGDTSDEEEIEEDGRQRRKVTATIKICPNCEITDQSKWEKVPKYVSKQNKELSYFCTNCAQYLYRYGVPPQNNDRLGNKKKGAKKLNKSLTQKSSSTPKGTSASIKLKTNKKGGSKGSNENSLPPESLDQVSVRSQSVSVKNEKGSKSNTKPKAKRSSKIVENIKVEENKGNNEDNKFNNEDNKFNNEDNKFNKEDALKSETSEEINVDQGELSVKDLETKSVLLRNFSSLKQEHRNEVINQNENNFHDPLVQSSSKDIIQQQSTEVNNNNMDHEIVECNACFGDINNKDMKLICNQCQLKVHSYCYSSNQLQIKDSTIPWLCDYCNNLEEQIYSKYPICKICYQKKEDKYDLKATSMGNWIHLSCFGLLDELFINNENKIIGLSQLVKQTDNNSVCNICDSKLGIIIQCKHCKDCYHTYCAKKENLFVGFEKVENKNEDYSTTIVCKKHKVELLDSNLIHLKQLDSEGRTYLAKTLKSKFENPRVEQKNKDNEVNKINDSIIQTLYKKTLFNNYSCLNCEIQESICWWYIIKNGFQKEELNQLSSMDFSPFIEQSNQCHKLCHHCFITKIKKVQSDRKVTDSLPDYVQLFSNKIKRERGQEDEDRNDKEFKVRR